MRSTATHASSFEVLVKPLVNLIWLAGSVFLIGSLIALWPDAREQRRLAERYEAVRASMTAALVIGALLAAGAVVFVALPFLREPEAGTDHLDRLAAEQARLALAEARDQALAALKELELDHRTGKVNDDDYIGARRPCGDGQPRRCVRSDAWNGQLHGREDTRSLPNTRTGTDGRHALERFRRPEGARPSPLSEPTAQEARAGAEPSAERRPGAHLWLIDFFGSSASSSSLLSSRHCGRLRRSSRRSSQSTLRSRTCVTRSRPHRPVRGSCRRGDPTSRAKIRWLEHQVGSIGRGWGLEHDLELHARGSPGSRSSTSC